MSASITKKLVRYRSWIVAVVNAAVTWVILIIAPLGLFGVILCTGAVFFASLVVGEICDRALFQLLRQQQRDVMQARREGDSIDLGLGSYLDLPNQEEEEKQ